ncbi:MAG TPA: hypothetical protein VHP82_00255 [Gaiellaceae bacterium]|jgi:hypothetical protein|nr:hypothetical protein [Gaiellaceae bacterium]
MLIEKCKNLLYKRGPIVLACCASFALGSLATATLTTSTDAATTGPRAAAAVPVSFLSGLDTLPSAVEHVRAHVQAHVRAVRRRHDPKPKTRSQATISLYERTTNPGIFRQQGCSAARRGATGVIILDFGKPSYNGHTYGTILFSGAFAGNRDITRAMGAYATGYVRCLPRGSADRIHLARGTSNYHPSVPSVYKAGRKWARETMQLQRALRAAHFDSHVTAAAADDVEPAWDPSFWRTRDFYRGYADSRVGHPLYNYGSLDGGIVSGYWNAHQAFFVTGGMRYAHAIPEIYNRTMAQEWAALAQVAKKRYHRPVKFAGVMTEHTSSNHGVKPRDAHRMLVRELAVQGHGNAPARVPAAYTNIHG